MIPILNISRITYDRESNKVAGLRAGQLRNHGSIPGRGNKSLFQSVQNGSGAHTAPYSVGPGITGRGEKSATHLYVVPKLRTSGVIPPLLIRVRGMDMDYFTFFCGSLFGEWMIWYSWVGRVIGCGRTSGVRLLAAVGIFLYAPTYSNAVGVSLQCIDNEGYFLQ